MVEVNMEIVTDLKTCKACGKSLPVTAFYKRSSVRLDSYTSECKSCMIARSRNIPSHLRHLPADVPRAKSEILALDYLRSACIPALPGKAFKLAHVDVVAWGCVWIEVKYSSLRADPRPRFQFAATPLQIKRGYLAHVMMLICDYGDKQTYHLFPSDHEVFYREYADGARKVKSAVSYIPDVTGSTKRGAPGTITPTDDLMKAHEGKIDFIEQARLLVSKQQ
jgi:hypothetical protein